MGCFNPRPHTAGDVAWGSGPRNRLRFNPRPHTAGDLCSTPLNTSLKCFNPRPHTAGDHKSAPCKSQRWFQSTPAHGGRRSNRIAQQHHGRVSIHARTRRATCIRCGKLHNGTVSIHARTRRATTSTGMTCTNAKFQSTPAHGGRRNASTHPYFSGVFQSTPAHGGRRAYVTIECYAEIEFQSTPAHGGRPERPCKDVPGKHVSIHARTRRATGAGRPKSTNHVVSIHARTRRATSPKCAEAYFPHVSIHARTRRATVVFVRTGYP